MPIVKGISKRTGLEMLKLKRGKVDLQNLEKRYKDVYDANELTGQKIISPNSAPIRIRTNSTKDGTHYIFFHPNITKRKVNYYEDLFHKLESLVKLGKIEYNPLAKILFKKASDGSYWAVASDAGPTLAMMYSRLKNPHKVADEIINIYNMMRELGFSHGHLHENNVCIDKNGRIKVIDISELDRVDIKSFSSLYRMGDILSSLSLLEHGLKVPLTEKTYYWLLRKTGKMSESQINGILKTYENHLRKIKGLPEENIKGLVSHFRYVIVP